MPSYAADQAPPDCRVALHALTGDELRPMLSLLPIAKPLPTRKHDMVVAIEAHLKGNRLAKTWASLEEVQQLAVREAAYAEGRFDPAQFKAKYGRLPAGFGKLGYRESSLLRLFLHPNVRYGQPRIMPVDLGKRVKAIAEVPPPATLASSEELPASVALERRGYRPKNEGREVEDVPLIVREMERAAVQDLLAVLRLVDQGAIAVGAKTRRPSAAALRRIADVLHDGDFFDPLQQKAKKWLQVPGPIRTFAWPWLVQAAKLVRLRGTKLELTNAGRAALAAPAAQTLRQVWEHWVPSKVLDEFSRIDDI